MLLDIRLGLTRYTEAAYRQRVYDFEATSVDFPPTRLSLEQYSPDFGTRNQRYNVSNIISTQPLLS